jgi:hypothetical protein
VVGIIFLCSLGFFKKQKDKESPSKAMESDKKNRARRGYFLHVMVTLGAIGGQ